MNFSSVQASRREEGGWFVSAWQSRDVLLVAAMALVALAVASFAWSFWNPRALHSVVGFAALAVMLLPLVRRANGDDFVSLWAFATVSVFIGITLRSLYLTAGWPDESTLQHLFIRGESDAFFDVGSMLVLATVCLMSLTYTLTASRLPMREPLQVLNNYRFDPRALRLFVGMFAILGFVAFYQFAEKTGGLSLLNPSMKRAASPGLHVPEDWQTFGYLRQGGGLSAVSFFALLAFYVKERLPMFPWRLPLLMLLFLNAALMPFYTSSRGGVMWLMLATGAVLHYAGARLRPRHLVLAVILSFLVFYVMSFLRSNDVDELGELIGSSPLDVVDSLVLTRNMLDPFTTAHVVNNIPGKLEWKNGESLYGWLVTPIPRELWPNKPRVNIGPEVGILVFGLKRAGVPPGLPAEMYWNLGFPGVLLGASLLGFALRYLHVRFVPGKNGEFSYILVYCAGLIQFGHYALGTAVGQAIFNALLACSQIAIFLWLVSSRRGWFGGSVNGGAQL